MSDSYMELNKNYFEGLHSMYKKLERFTKKCVQVSNYKYICDNKRIYLINFLLDILCNIISEIREQDFENAYLEYIKLFNGENRTKRRNGHYTKENENNVFSLIFDKIFYFKRRFKKIVLTENITPLVKQNLMLADLQEFVFYIVKSLMCTNISKCENFGTLCTKCQYIKSFIVLQPGLFYPDYKITQFLQKLYKQKTDITIVLDLKQFKEKKWTVKHDKHYNIRDLLIGLNVQFTIINSNKITFSKNSVLSNNKFIEILDGGIDGFFYNN